MDVPHSELLRIQLKINKRRYWLLAPVAEENLPWMLSKDSRKLHYQETNKKAGAHPHMPTCPVFPGHPLIQQWILCGNEYLLEGTAESQYEQF